MIRNSTENHTGCFLLLGLSGRVETKQKQNGKTPQCISHVYPLPWTPEALWRARAQASPLG